MPCDSPWIGPKCAWCVISRFYSYSESFTIVPRERVPPFHPLLLIFLKRRIQLAYWHKKREQSRILPILCTVVRINYYIYGRFAMLIEVD